MASTYLTRTTGSPTNSKKFTVSGWFKIFDTTENQFLQHYTDGSNREHMYFASGTFRWYCNDGGTTRVFVKPNMQFTDMAAFYHIVIACDTTQNTVSDRVKIYVNGSQITSFDTATYPPQNFDFLINSNNKLLAMGRYMGIDDYYYDGIISHFHFIDGTQYDATAFGETDTTTGEWKIKSAPSVTYGNNGYFILRDGNSVTDQSGNSNNFTVAGGTLTKTEDCPDNVFATMNPLDNHYANGTFTNGNNTVTSLNTGYTYNTSTIGVNSGKFYWECKWSAQPTGSSNQVHIGIAKRIVPSATTWLGQQLYTYAYQASSGHVFHNNVEASGSSATTYAVGDIISLALDLDNNKIHFAKNGTWTNSSNPSANSGGVTITAPDSTSGDSGFYFAAFGDSNVSLQETGQFNFGNGFFGTSAVADNSTATASTPGTFNYDVPAGYQPLTTKGLNA